ncbi:MAG: DUF2807 domain-containing protein [Flavobacteriaceae bacterium]|nr:DUF2807 domain-containing protein [Flavobacteriaceae bacterium]
MYKILLAIITISSLSQLSAQTDRIKGNRAPVTKIHSLDAFNSLQIGENFEVTLVPGSEPKLEINADDNLHEYISFEVINNSLVITTTARITSKKELSLRVYFQPGLEKIFLQNDVSLKTLTQDSDFGAKLVIELKEDARIEGSFKAKQLVYKSADYSRGEIQLQATDSLHLALSNSSKLKADVSGRNMQLSLGDRVDAELKGSVNGNNVFNASGKVSLKADALVVERLSIDLSEQSSAWVNVTDVIEIKASGRSKLYLYNTPAAFSLLKLNDEAMIQKQ